MMHSTPIARLLTPAIVLVVALHARTSRAEPAGIAPNMYPHGNLRVALTCAGDFVTPHRGLRVTVVGDVAPLKPLRLNAVSQDTVDENGAPTVMTYVTDVGFLAPPGRQRIRLEAPDCAAEDREIDVSPSHSTTIDGSLRVTTPSLLGPVGAPDGFGILLAAFTSTFPRSIATGTASTHAGGAAADFTLDRSTVQGAIVSFSGEHRNAVFALDHTFAYGSLSGHTFPQKGPAGPFDVTGSFAEFGLVFRLGARLPLHDFALMAGSGLGGSVWIRQTHLDAPGRNDVAATTPTGPGLSWHVPLWAGITFKPACGWGLQLLASYAITPTNFDANTASLAGGILFQPSTSCDEAPGVNVSP